MTSSIVWRIEDTST